MKKQIKFFMSALACLVIMTFSAFSVSAAQIVTIQTSGMVCEVCTGAVIGAFQELEGIENVAASHETGLVTLSIADDADLSDETLTTIITDAGFTVDKVER